MGVVSDSETGETLPFANVFFTGTTYGSVTDVNGFFEIELKDKGTYELIVKFVGYDTYATTVEVLSNNDLRFDIKLNLSSVNLGSVVVTDKNPAEWRRNLSLFKQAFLGSSKNSTKCKIVNEEAINFYYDEQKRTLEAYCSEPIMIENRALGYQIDYYLEHFLIDKKNGLTTFYGFTQYKESKPAKDPKKKFLKARNRAFYGSIEHFFRSLYANSLKNEGWEVMLAEDVGSRGRLVNNSDYDVFKDVQDGPTDLSKTISFEGYMYVVYTKELESIEFSGQRPLGSRESKLPQRSWIKMVQEDEAIGFEKSGYVLNPISFVSNGYWGFEKIADMLPVNYQPSIQ